MARNALTDRQRCSREHPPLPEDLPAPAIAAAPSIDGLSQRLPQFLAERLGLSPPGTRSRLQRPRLISSGD